MAKITLVNGSMNPYSNTKRTLIIISDCLLNKGHDTELINVSELNIPLFNPSERASRQVNQLRQKFRESDGFIIGSPAYHGGCSGALKNLIDYLCVEVFMYKPLGLVIASGGIGSGINTLNSLRIIFRALYAQVIPQQVAISQQGFNQNGDLDPKCKQKILGVIDGLHGQPRGAHQICRE